ncbi:MAG: LytTR family DNA-binding domain-containing protein [Bacteroidia bacterium]|jgi:two-component system LytT family response regulator|nr:LytTR family DNA-binding domain-containing protein [Bacteroidia bacterium]
MNPDLILRAILIDDEFMGLNSLHILLDRHCPKVKSVAECRNPELAIEMIENYCPDIVFLDINMPQMNGFEMLKKLKYKGFDLIFTTAHREYALKALKSDAVDYLLKPIDADELKAAVEKVLERKILNKPGTALEVYNDMLNSLLVLNKPKVIVNSKSGIESIETKQIIGLESKSNYTQFYLENGDSLKSSKSLKQYEEILCGNRSSFMRVHHSFIINLNKVIRYLKTSDMLVMLNGQEIPISKSRKEEFMKWLEK